MIDKKTLSVAYTTDRGVFYNGKIEVALKSKKFKKYKGKVSLIFTSPPFPLNRKKKYGNLQGEEYVNWLSDLAILFKDFLTEDGSIVIEVGNSWEPGIPAMSTLALKSLLAFQEKGGYFLCQQFVWYNSAKLPSPAQWVNIERSRVKDSFTHIWRMSKVAKPKADNRKILKEYSQSMKTLLRTKKYNSGKRPSEHSIGKKSFFKNNNGAIPSNVLISSNTHANTDYQNYCMKKGLVPHPARMPIDIPNFFIRFLTSPKNLVMDPFGGSNTTGEAAELLKRRWVSVELNLDYIKGSKGRFKKKMNQSSDKLVLDFKPREWQVKALDQWEKDFKGIVSVVTGGGKTLFALLCVVRFKTQFPAKKIIIVVPTLTLLDQWYVSLIDDLKILPGVDRCFF